MKHFLYELGSKTLIYFAFILVGANDISNPAGLKAALGTRRTVLYAPANAELICQPDCTKMYQKISDASGCNVFAYQYVGYPGTSAVQLSTPKDDFNFPSENGCYLSAL